MSLEKAIKKLTQVIQAQTPPGPSRGVPDGSPIGREMAPRDACRNVIPGDGAYCKCYKEKNKKYTGPCYFQGSNGKCYVKIYREGSQTPDSETLDGPCPSIGIPPQNQS